MMSGKPDNTGRRFLLKNALALAIGVTSVCALLWKSCDKPKPDTLCKPPMVCIDKAYIPLCPDQIDEAKTDAGEKKSDPEIKKATKKTR